MHHPVSFSAFPCTPLVINQGFLQTYAIVKSTYRVYRLVDPSSFPESRPCNPVWPYAVPVFSSSSTKEVPFLLYTTAQFANFCTVIRWQLIKKKKTVHTETVKLTRKKMKMIESYLEDPKDHVCRYQHV